MFQARSTNAEAETGAWLLLREMGHRVANEYAFAIGSLSLAAARTSDAGARAALDRAIDRLFACARAHRVLKAPGLAGIVDVSAYLERIGEALVRSTLEEKGITLTIAAEPVEIEADRCWRVGMIVSEWIANAARHAFSRAGGEIRVDVALVDDLVHCRVRDNGTPRPGTAPGQGGEIVAALAREIQGALSKAPGERGTSVLICFPLRAYPRRGRAGAGPWTRRRPHGRMSQQA